MFWSAGGYGSEFQEELNKRLTESGIFFRNIRLQFDGNKQIQIIPGGGQPLVNHLPFTPSNGHWHAQIRENIRNISAKIIRVAIVEPGSDQLDAFAAIRPCPQLNDQEKIREYSSASISTLAESLSFPSVMCNAFTTKIGSTEVSAPLPFPRNSPWGPPN